MRALEAEVELTTPQRIRELCHVGFGRYLAAIACEWAMLAGAIVTAGALHHWVGYILAGLFIGTRQHSLAILGHDGAHRLMSKNRVLNDFLVNAFVFWPLGAICQGYREFHLEHHRKTTEDDDPERWVKFGWCYRIPSPMGKFVFLYVTDLVGGGILEFGKLIWICRGRSVGQCLSLAMFWGILAVPIVYWAAYWVVLLWFGAMVTSFWASFRVRSWSEHQGVHGTLRFHAGPLARFWFFPYNTWCHYEHHRWPAVPCFNLRKARELDDSIKIISMLDMMQFFAGDGSRVTDIPLRA